MKQTAKRLLALVLTLMMAMSLLTPALAAQESNTDAITYAALEEMDSSLVPKGTNLELTLSYQEMIQLSLNRSGLSEEQLGSYPEDYNSLALSLGMITGEEDLDADCPSDTASEMLTIAGQVKDAVEAGTPLFLNGMAQPIFPYTSGAVENAADYSNEDSDIIRYFVYVETDYDTDGDGQLDLVKALVQVPRAAAEGKYEAATIFEARPYITGCTEFWGNSSKYNYYSYEGMDLSTMYDNEDLISNILGDAQKDPLTTLQVAASAQSSDWYYYNPYEDFYDYEDLEWYDYYLVRGFAVVEAGGLGTLDSEGFETCGSDLEIAAFQNIIEWLHGTEGRVAYADKDRTQTVEADWSNGKVGMTGRSYGGTTQFGLATTGVEGLETIVPVAGIASWYEYTNSQGISTNRNPAYSDILALYCAGRRLDDEDWANIKDSYASYLSQIAQDQLALNGDYGDHWASRDYTLDAENIKCSALIVHGLNDDNVRTKEFELMYQSFQKAGAEAKLLLHQDGHLTPTYPGYGYEFYINGQSYDEILNKWFSHYLYGVDNGIDTDLATVTAQDSHDPDLWHTYDSWETAEATTLTAADTSEETTTISSDYSAIKVTSRNWKDTFTSGSTASSAMYVMDVEEDTTIKGTVAVSFTASTQNVTASAQAASVDDTADAPKGLDHDNYADPQQNDIGEAASSDSESAIMPIDDDSDTLDRDGLMVSAMLVDLGDGSKFDAINTTGSYVTKEYVAEGGVWQGGGLAPLDLVKLTSSQVSYKIIARGWMDLCNPGAGYASSSAGQDTKVNLVAGQDYDYTIYLQPNVYQVEAGHQLALVIYAYEPGKASYTQNYTITLKNDSVKAEIPLDDSELVDLTVTAGNGGSVSADVTLTDGSASVVDGSQVTVTATPNSGYVFSGWTVNGVDAGSASPATFTVDGDTTIAASFTKRSSSSSGSSNNGSSSGGDTTIEPEEPPTSEKPADQITFTDVSDTSYAADAIAWAVEEGITTGTSDTTFSPKAGCTRAQVVTFLWRASGSPAAADSDSFLDVSEDAYYADAVAWAVEQNITNGTSATTFSPNDICTRAQIVTLLARFSQGLTGQEVSSTGFADVSSSAYYAEAVAWAVKEGVTTGTSATTFSPSATCTREQVVTFLYRCFQ